jgi:Flp pilus assembly pilin Flp
MTKQTLEYFIARLRLNEEGATATEYALLVFFVAIVIIAGATALGIAINATLQQGADALP